VSHGAAQRVFFVAGDFEREPQSENYADLLRSLASLSYRALLITRHEAWSEQTETFLERLKPWSTVTEERSGWPNTSLRPPNTEVVHEFSLSPEVVLALSESVSGLYGWGSPLPEDLAFLREDGSVVLFSTTHEEEAGLCLAREERERLEVACRWIANYVTWREPSAEEQRMRLAGR
jgi:hypothetical protein